MPLNDLPALPVCKLCVLNEISLNLFDLLRVQLVNDGHWSDVASPPQHVKQRILFFLIYR